jgi:hypothetical protein
MMLLLTSTLLLADNDINGVNDVDDADDVNDIDDADDVNDVDDANDVNDADANDANDEKRRRSSIEEEKESRLDTNLDRVERLVVCCFFVPLAASQAKSSCTRLSYAF